MNERRRIRLLLRRPAARSDRVSLYVGPVPNPARDVSWASTWKTRSVPSVLIEVRRPLGERAGADIIEAVHGALREAFKIPANDRCIRLVVHEPHRFECPPDRESPELYTHVSLDAFAGRTLEAKRSLYRRIVENLESLGIPRDHVKVLLREIPREDWGIRGGQAGSDVELGFQVEV